MINYRNHEYIRKTCKKYNITNYIINQDGSIDVEGNVSLSEKNLDKLLLMFKNVGGDFDCSDNQLTTLKGSPESVGGDFYCSDNQLTTLEGSPKSVGGGFYCSNNKLTSLEGSPKSVGGNFNCSNNQLTSLEGSPESVGGGFYCHNNPIALIYYLFHDEYNYSLIDFFNDCEIIYGNELSLYRLNGFLLDIDIPEVTNEQLERIKKYYKVI